MLDITASKVTAVPLYTASCLQTWSHYLYPTSCSQFLHLRVYGSTLYIYMPNSSQERMHSWYYICTTAVGTSCVLTPSISSITSVGMPRWIVQAGEFDMKLVLLTCNSPNLVSATRPYSWKSCGLTQVHILLRSFRYIYTECRLPLTISNKAHR